MKKALSIALSFALLLSTAFASMPKQLETTTHRIEMSIQTTDENGKTVIDRDICSSTAIGSHALLTATHCDMGASVVAVDGNPAAIMERLADGNDHTIYIVNINFGNYAEFSTGKLKLGDEVWLRGNPAGLNQLVRYGHYAGSIVVPMTGSVGNSGSKVFQMFDINGWFGDSGSSIFDKHGRIVAVTSLGFNDGGFVMLAAFAFQFTPAQLAKATK